MKWPEKNSPGDAIFPLSECMADLQWLELDWDMVSGDCSQLRHVPKTHVCSWVLYSRSCLMCPKLFPVIIGYLLSKLLQGSEPRVQAPEYGAKFQSLSCPSNPKTGAKTNSLNKDQLVGSKEENVWLEVFLYYFTEMFMAPIQNSELVLPDAIPIYK